MTRSKILFIALLMLALPAESAAGMSLALDYGRTPGYDNDNDGIESASRGIDFSVVGSSVINPKTACTRWLTYFLDTGSSEVVCYGNLQCCSYAGLPAQEDSWNGTFYLIYGTNTGSLENSVLAQLMQYNEAAQTSNYTAWELLTATFSEYSVSGPEINDSGAIISIYSPDNSSYTAETIVFLNVSISRNATLEYSLDNGSYIPVNGSYDGGASYFFQKLNGTLDYGILMNGRHSLQLNFYPENENASFSMAYNFTVNDTAPPAISSGLNTSISLLQKSTFANISSNEISSITATSQNAFLASWNGTYGALNLSLDNGYNEFNISIADLNNNTASYSFFVNASIAILNCSDGIMNYHEGQNETGIDCGGSCSACVSFTVSTDKAQYAPGELAYIRVTARSDAAHNITVTAQDFYYSLAYSGSTYYILNPTKAGSYTINVSLNYKGNIETQLGSFEVSQPAQTNPLSLSITANETSLYTGDYALFSASISGNTSAASYKWDFDSDSQNESGAGSIIRLYNESGQFNVTLHATNGNWNISAFKTIQVKGHYRVTVFLTDKATLQQVDGEISIGGIFQNSSSGSASFELKDGEYSLSVSAPEYETYSKALSITSNASINASLSRKRADALMLSILAPANNTIAGNTVLFSYKVEDSAAAACTLYISAYGEEWSAAQKGSAIEAGQGEFSATLPNGTSYWKINCTDAEGRANSSGARAVEVNANALYVDLEKENQKAEDAAAAVDQSIQLLKSFDTKEQELIEDMQLAEYLAGLKKQIERANRDLHNLKWRRLNQTEQAKLEKELVKKVAEAKQGAIKDIKVIKASEFVNYPKEPDIALLSSSVYAREAAKLDMEAFNEKNTKLQSYVTTTTKYRIAEITYESETRAFSVITKKMSYSRNISEDVIMYEIIPKEFADNASRITFLFDHEVIEQDPIIKFARREQRFSYYIEGEASLGDANKAKTVVLSSKPPVKKSNELSGNAILGLPFRVNVDARVIAEVIILALLIIFYIAYSLLFSGVDKNLLLAQKKLQSASSSIVSGDYDGAKALYAELRVVFAKLKPAAKKRLYPVMSELSHKINALFLKKKIVEASLYAESNPKQAHLIYSDIAALYRQLPDAEKKGVHAECAELSAKIARSLKNEKPTNA